MPHLRNYNIVISHAWSYSAEYYRIEDWLNNAPNLSWTNLSIPEHDPLADDEELARELNNQMRLAHVFVIIGGMYVAHRQWIQHEINFARRIGRPILGIRPHASIAMPLAVQNAATEVVGWNSNSIVRSIRRIALPEDD